ncbi:MAG: ABC transporter substrate-binding protein [Methylocystaceae bacterium]|nr:ABC transporter substrate-binding protein [Methylocystaceae bacterium]
MLKTRFLFALVLTLSLAISTTPSFAEDFGKKAETFIQTMADKAMATYRSDKDEKELELEFRNLLNEDFDVRAIGKWVLGRYWRKATDSEKEEYLKLFEDFIIVTYANRFKDYSGTDITLNVTESLTKNDQDAIVRSQIIRPETAEPILVDWRVKGNKNDELKIVDVLIAGVSMSQTQRSEFASVIKRNGGEVAGLIDALRSKTTQLVSNVNKAAN